MQPTLLSGISSRTQIDAKGKVKHLFEITQGSNAKLEEKEKVLKSSKEVSKERKKLTAGGRSTRKKKNTNRTQTSKVNMVPIALNLVN